MLVAIPTLFPQFINQPQSLLTLRSQSEQTRNEGDMFVFSISFNMHFHSYGISIGNHSLRQRFADWCSIVVECGVFRCKGEQDWGKTKNHSKNRCW